MGIIWSHCFALFVDGNPSQDHANVYAERAEAIEKEMEGKLSKAKASLEESATRLVGRTANSAQV